MMAVSAMDSMDLNCVPMLVELSVVLCFGLGFVSLQKNRFFGQRPKHNWTPEEAQEMMCSSIEDHIVNGDAPAALALWRAAKEYTPASVEALRLLSQALLGEDPSALIPEIVEHMRHHAEDLCTPAAAAAVLDAIGRAGCASYMEEMLETMQKELGFEATPQMYEALIAGYATSGTADEVVKCLERIRACKQKVTVRGFAIALRGLLNKQDLDASLDCAKDMCIQGFQVPPFAVTEIFRLASDVDGPGPQAALDMAEQCSFKLTTDAVSLLLDCCLHLLDAELAHRAIALAKSQKTPLCLQCYNTALKLYAPTCEPEAINLLEEVFHKRLPFGTTLRRSLEARASEAGFKDLLDRIVLHDGTK